RAAMERTVAMAASSGCVGNMGGGDTGGRKQRVQADGGVGPSSPAAAWWTALETDVFEENGRSEMGHDRSGMKLKLLMTGEEDSPRVASVINVGLRSQQIWNVRIIVVVMSGLDGPMECLTAVGFRRWQARLTAMRGGRRRVRRRGRADGSFDGGIGRWLPASGDGFIGGSHGCRPSWLLEEGGAP
ncbi:hypothetical protein ACLOJK_003836, partial [Asimina triloba]